MTKFEQVGINYQYSALTKEEAQKSFSYSCKCCCNKGMRLDCDKCNISHVHSMVMAFFNDKNNK